MILFPIHALGILAADSTWASPRHFCWAKPLLVANLWRIPEASSTLLPGPHPDRKTSEARRIDNKDTRGKARVRVYLHCYPADRSVLQGIETISLTSRRFSFPNVVSELTAVRFVASTRLAKLEQSSLRADRSAFLRGRGEKRQETTEAAKVGAKTPG